MLDLTPGQGELCRAALSKRIPYVGVAMTALHADKLREQLTLWLQHEPLWFLISYPFFKILFWGRGYCFFWVWSIYLDPIEDDHRGIQFLQCRVGDKLEEEEG